METLLATQHLATLANHVTSEPAVAGADWDGVALEVAFDRRSTIYMGRIHTADGKNTTWAPSSRVLMAAANRLRKALPASTRSILICLRPDTEPWALVNTDHGPHAIPDEHGAFEPEPEPELSYA